MSATVTEHAASAPPAFTPRRARRKIEERGFRPEIQGLRAIAVLLVVLYHAHVPGMPGGYAGVDVFFVISGYLITGQLMREVATRGRVHFASFYMRRVRRLLPPAALVVVATVVASRIWAAPLQTKSTSTDALFTVFYSLNYRLADLGIDYQHANAAPSPLQHFWSLAVEEQFYLIWPVLITVIALVGRRRKSLLGLVLVFGGVLSFVTSLHLIHSNPPLAYFSLQSRAWELAVGALVAIVGERLLRMSSWLGGLMATAGLVVIIGSAALFTDATRFPGTAALLPVGGAALVIAAGCGGARWPERLVLGLPFVQGLGRVSYPFYLWHWPVLILAPAVIGHALSWPAQLALMGGALGLAILTQYLVERPLHRLKLGTADWAAGGLVVSLVTTTIAVVVGANALAGIATPGKAFAAPSTGLVDPFAGTVTSGQVTPTVVRAASDTPAYPANCIVNVQGTTSPSCLIGANGQLSKAAPAAGRYVLLGDSHAGEFFDPIQTVAATESKSVEVLNKVACPLANVQTVESALQRNYTECDTWRSNVLQRLASEPKPAIIFIAQLNRYEVSNAALVTGWHTTLTKLEASGAPIVYLKDTPVPNADVPTCLSAALSHWSTCDFSRSTALPNDALANGSFGLTATVDIDSYLCPGVGPSCPAVRDGVLLYRDDSHVTRTAMSALAPLIGQSLVNDGLLNGTSHALPLAGTS